jgi:hypothetical protein
MNPFRYPEIPHLRSQNPGPFSDYRRYKPFLRIEFIRQCVYCRMPDGVKGETAFGVDHYRPSSKFPGLRTQYQNLFYSCNVCNWQKGNFWPDSQRYLAGLFIPNPCDHTMADHLAYRGVTVEARSRTGQLAIDVLLLNDSKSEVYRRWMLRSIERCLWEAELILRTLADLSRISEERGPAASEELLHDRSLLEARFAGIQEDLERLSCHRLIRET